MPGATYPEKAPTRPAGDSESECLSDDILDQHRRTGELAVPDTRLEGCGQWHAGHLGSQRVSARAMARRRVEKELGKWRSGREEERTGITDPLELRGSGWKTVQRTLRHDERVTTQHHRDVVMPTGEAPSFEVIEADLSLELRI